MFNRISSSFRASSPVEEDKTAAGTVASSSTSTKRPITDTSIINANIPDAKRPTAAVSDTVSEMENSMLETLKDLIIGNQSLIRDVKSSLETKFDDVLNRMQTLEASVSARDAAISNLDTQVRELVCENVTLKQRIEVLEARPVVGQGEGSLPATGPVWAPTGSPDTRILLLGDSNSAGKIKFGTGKGKLGAALPGTSTFCAKYENLTTPASDEFANVSDLVLAVACRYQQPTAGELEPSRSRTTATQLCC